MTKTRRTARPDPRFPEDFVFGVATSDHQCEAYDPEREDIRDLWEKATGRTPRGRATDFWNRYPEDVRLARDLGCKAFRFSVSWTRVEPKPGQYDEAALEHYRQLSQCIVDAGMRPIVTLHHFTWPPYLEAEGGMLGETFADHFAAYAEVVAQRLGAQVGWWITFNEPTFVPLGYLKIWGQRDYMMPPGLGGASNAEQIDAASALMRSLFVAHARARTRIRGVVPGAKVGTNPFVLGMPVVVQNFLDRIASRTGDPAEFRRREERQRAGNAGASSGDVDVAMGALSWTPERERHVLFSKPYATSRPQLLVRAGSPITEARRLGGARIAFERSTNSAPLLRALPEPPRLRPVRTLREGLELVHRGHVAGLASDDLLLDMLVKRGDPAWRRVDLASNSTWTCAAITPNLEGLLEELDAAIDTVVGTGGAASVARVSPSREPVPSRDGLTRIRERGELVVAVRRGDSPFSRCDAATGAWSGLEVDIARALAARLLGDPARVRFVQLAARDRTRKLHSWRSRLRAFIARWRGLLSALTNTNWWYLGMAGKLPEFLCPAECVGQLDFVGFDYYWGVPEVRWDRLARLFDSLGGRYSRAPVYPGGLLRLLRRYRRMFKGMDLLIIENGSVEHADGVSRANYLRRHLREVQRACEAGIPVRAYVCWSITTNREWGLPLGIDSDFGLYRIDLDTDPELKRVRTPAADLYAGIIRNRDARSRERKGRNLLGELVRKAKAKIGR